MLTLAKTPAHRLVCGAVLLLLAGSASAEVLGPAVSVQFGPDGRLWRVTPYADRVEVDHSGDRGRSFSAPVVVGPPGQVVRAQPEGRPEILATADGRVFVSWAVDDGGRPALRVAWSEDGGQGFSAPVAVPATVSPPPQLRGHLHEDPAGQVRLFWIDPMDLAGDPAREPGGALYVATLPPAAGTGLLPQRLSGLVCECCRLATASAADGTPLLFGRFVFPGSERDPALLRLTGTGGMPVLQRTSIDGWELAACPDHGPALAVAGGRQHLLWFTQGRARQGLFHAYMDDGDQAVSMPLPVGERGRLAGHGDVLAAGDTVVLAWRQFDGRAASVHVMVSRDRGESFGEPRLLAEASGATDYPFLHAGDGIAWLSWYSRQHGWQLLEVTAL